MGDDGTQPMQADGQDSPKLRPDGTAPAQRGRGPAGESNGGAYSDGGGKSAAEEDTALVSPHNDRSSPSEKA
ncbi:hypothetical protein ACFSGX_02510 [Sphingomonas arantia]|uniref:Uncharacterized protein n=1 Tax=Sphingomonas arantia TaxID=1460676 RepID=A0ABW4TW44_9SPHN